MTPSGFEAAHEEWLSLGGEKFRDIYRFHATADFYESRYWELVREEILAIRNFRCCRCGGEAYQVHHLNYNHVGEDHFYPESLVAICRPCHGLVEYARQAESLVSRIQRRISLCNDFLEDRRGCLDQNATHIYARLLEYQDQLAELQRLFSDNIHYNNTQNRTRPEVQAIVIKFQQKREAYEQRAKFVISKWSGDEKEKAEQLLPMQDAEIANCWKFVEEVFAPVSKSERQGR